MYLQVTITGTTGAHNNCREVSDYVLFVTPLECIHIQSLELGPELLDQREIVHVDIAYDDLSSGEYREDLVSLPHMNCRGIYNEKDINYK